QKPSKWDIIEFLEQCDLEPYGKKVDLVVSKKEKRKGRRTSQKISHSRGYSRKSRPPSHKISVGAQATHDSLPGTGDPRFAPGVLMFKTIRVAIRENKPNQQRVKDWEKTRKSSNGSSIHIHNIHNSTLSGNSLIVAGNTSITKATTKRKREGLREGKVVSYAESLTENYISLTLY
ncbi:15820_t:CDS:2, partial [Dentiscutata erythropus]